MQARGVGKYWPFGWKVDLWLTILFGRISKCSLSASKASPNVLLLISRSSNNTWHVVPPTPEAPSDLWCLSLAAGTLTCHLRPCFETQSTYHYSQDTALLPPHVSVQMLSILLLLLLGLQKQKTGFFRLVILKCLAEDLKLCRHTYAEFWLGYISVCSQHLVSSGESTGWLLWYWTNFVLSST